MVVVREVEGERRVQHRGTTNILCKKKIVMIFPPVSLMLKYLLPTGTGSVPPICAAQPTQVELSTLPILPSSITFLSTSVTGLVWPCMLKHVFPPFSCAVAYSSFICFILLASGSSVKTFFPAWTAGRRTS